MRRRFRIGLMSSLPLLAIMLAGQGAAACDPTTLLEYQVQNGRYQIEINDVYLDSGASQFASGGVVIDDWLLAGANVVRVEIDADRGDFTLHSLCENGDVSETYDQASLNGRAEARLSFTAEASPPRAYLPQSPTTDEGLLDAVAALTAAMTDRDFDAVWDLHAAMRADLELNGRSVKAAAYQMRKITEAINPVVAPGLVTRSVLGGRVWEVFGDDFAPPISAVVEVNGGRVNFRTGSFWMRLDGRWSVLEK